MIKTMEKIIHLWQNLALAIVRCLILCKLFFYLLFWN